SALEAPRARAVGEALPPVQVSVLARARGGRPAGAPRRDELPEATDGDLVLVEAEAAHRRGVRLARYSVAAGRVRPEVRAALDGQARAAALAAAPAVGHAGAAGRAAPPVA